jgi:HEAT repeat protein
MDANFKDTLHRLATESQLHTAYLFILSKMDKEALKIFRAEWPIIPVARRRAIMQELLEISEANFEVDFVPVFLLALADEDATVRAIAIPCLWEYEDISLIRPLIHLLKADPAPEVREAAATGLGKFVYLRELEEIDPYEGSLAEEALLETIYQAAEELHVRRRAVEAVAYSSDPRVGPIIESAYYHEHEKMQVSAIFAMGRNADLAWLPQVIAELDNPVNEIRFEACRACGELEARDAVERLITIIDEDDDQEIKEMAVWALGRIGGTMAKEALELCMDHENEALALAAEEALEELNLFGDELMLYDFDDYSDIDEDEIDFFADDIGDFIGPKLSKTGDPNDYLN